MREICPDKLILADFKTPDVGGLEATMAFDAGADMITVIGGAAIATVKEAYAVARDRGKIMLMELTGVRDILARATEWRQYRHRPHRLPSRMGCPVSGTRVGRRR